MRNGEGNESGFRQWVHPAPRAVFLLVHGLGAHTGRWEAMADFFLARGISSYAATLAWPASLHMGRKGFFGDYRDGILRLRDRIASENPSKKIFIIGESMGGLISFLLAAEKPGSFDGLICLSPAFANKITLPLRQYLSILVSLVYDPAREFAVPFTSAMCTRDAEYRKKMDADPREKRSFSSRLLFDILKAQVAARHAAKRMATPVLFLTAGDDRIVDCAASRQIYENAAAKDKAFMEFPGMYHALSIDIGKEAVFEEMLKWVEKRVQGRVP